MKEMDKNTKRIIIFGSLLLILCIILIAFINKKAKPIYIVMNDRGVQYQNSNWTNIDLNSQIFGKYQFTVYDGNENKGNYEINYVNDRWYFFDENKNSHNLELGNVLAYYGDVSVEEFNTESLSDDDLAVINGALSKKDYSISSLAELTSAEKVVYDFDNDGSLETMYSFNNIDQDSEYAYSGLIYTNEENVEIVALDINDMDDQDDLKLYSFNNIIRLNNKNNNYLILSAFKNLDVDSTYNMIYSFSKKGPKLEQGESDISIRVKVTEKDYFGRTVLIIILGVVVLVGAGYIYVRYKKNNDDEI